MLNDPVKIVRKDFRSETLYLFVEHRETVPLKIARGLNPHAGSHPNPCSCCQVSPDITILIIKKRNAFIFRPNGILFGANGNFFCLNGNFFGALCGFVYICIEGSGDFAFASLK